jgi:signal transduction histidine kinase
MVLKKNRSDLLKQTFQRLVSAIMYRTQDPETDLREIMADSITGFGTGKHEIFKSRDEYIEKIFRVFGKQLPSDAKLHFTDIQTIELDFMAMVHATTELSYVLNGEDTRYYVRRSVVFSWVKDHWCAIYMHVSEPSVHLIEGESFPVEALKAQNEELQKQVNLKTDELSRSLKELQATQQQLIQAAKMASLGELTAGIAHEIQNPLNFVNNFSELNGELIDELKTDLTTGDLQKARDVADTIKENEAKIVFHGKRADGIVKSMLQHSRASTGKKELADINGLTDEYIKLAYHGLRAKDKTFNAKFETELDPRLGKINIIPQEIGRVILNLINNAFYAVNEKKKKGIEGYEPIVKISTKDSGDKVEIRVADNGSGIPQKVLEKIFQPFFTTKPTGEGTGLGLSLSYDIVTKAHRGQLKVESKDGEGTEFIISLPKQ